MLRDYARIVVSDGLTIIDFMLTHISSGISLAFISKLCITHWSLAQVLKDERM
jgi:hypothetical protein